MGDAWGNISKALIIIGIRDGGSKDNVTKLIIIGLGLYAVAMRLTGMRSGIWMNTEAITVAHGRIWIKLRFRIGFAEVS